MSGSDGTGRRGATLGREGRAGAHVRGEAGTAAHWSRVVVAIAGRPLLWSTALRQLRRTTPPGWYRRSPRRPLPPQRYVEFRMTTQYGDPSHRPSARDVVNYLSWCRDWDSDV